MESQFLHIFHCTYILVSPSLSLCLFETGLYYNLLSIRLLMCQAKFKLNMRILARVFIGGTCAIVQEIMCRGSLIFG